MCQSQRRLGVNLKSGRLGRRLLAGGVDRSTDQWIVAGQHLIITGGQYRYLFAFRPQPPSLHKSRT